MRAAWLFVLLALIACGDDLDTFHVVRGNIAMPVVVRGPRDADTLIVYQHGGPGEADLDGVMAFERNLQRRFLYASWAQRTSAFASGPITRRNTSFDEHYRDMQAVLQVLRKRYPAKRLVALGYSFGGIVTLGHLGSEDAEPVDGIILIDAPVSGEVVQTEGFRLLDAFAETQIEAGNDVASWQSFRDLAESQPQAYAELSPRQYFAEYGQEQLDRCAAMERALGVDALPAAVEQSGAVNMSEPLVIPGLSVSSRVLDWRIPALVTFDLTEHARRIHTPTLLLWGEHDCKVAVPAGEYLLDALGTAEKELKIQPATGHFLPFQAPEFVSDEIEKFIDGL
jgi:pimeloyl-ACP methyl ester carboxylesterase